MARLACGLRLLGAIAFALQACGGGGTGPTSTPAKLSDPAKTATQLQSVAAPTASGTFRSFAVLIGHFVLAVTPGPATLTAVEPAAPAPPVLLGTLTAGTLRRALARQPDWAALFPDTTRGKTFVWDTTSGRYVASTAAGAPANGVRFMLYTVDPPAFLPSRPLSAIGYTDLTDQTTPSAAVLGVAIVGTTGSTPLTYASYHINRPSGQITGASLAGFVTDGVTRLDLATALTATLTSLTTQTTVDVAAQGLHISETASVSGTASVALATDLSLTSGAETVRANGTVTVDTTTGTAGGTIAVSVNGQAFATITVGPRGLSYTGASGVQLTPADETALRGLYITSFNLFAAVLSLAEPALLLNL